MSQIRCLAISGGVGGAKLALGLAHQLSPGELTIVANTGDDFEHLGFAISPDLDTVMYTLADLANKELGWGQAGETWQFLEALERLGGESWFRLGDRDLATHTMRTSMLRDGASLSEVTATLCTRLGIEHEIVPMSDHPVRTMVIREDGAPLSFQHYFVRDLCVPVVSGFTFDGIDGAAPSPGFAHALESGAPVVICPSNPFVSVDPVLSLQGVRDTLRASPAPVIAVSPIVGGQAIKGPAAKMMKELGMPQTAVAVASHYRGLVDAFVLDSVDEHLAPEIAGLGMEVLVTNTMMISLDDRVALARAVLDFAERLDGGQL